MKNEVRYSNFSETDNNVNNNAQSFKLNAVDLNTFIRLFVNHRPVYGIGQKNIQEAFQDILTYLKEDEGFEGDIG